MMVSLVSIVVNLTLNWTFVRVLGLGHVGLALSTSAVALGNCALLYLLLRRRVGPLGGGLTARLARIGAAAVVMGVVGAVADVLVQPHLPDRRFLHYAIELAATVPLSVAVFAGAGVLLGLPLPRPLGRRLPAVTP